MLADRLPIVAATLRRRRRSLVGWALALAAVCGIYIGFWPAMGGTEMQAMIDTMPEGLVAALGYDQIGTPAGYLESTVFGLLGPALLLVFAIGTGARLLAGEEEDGTLELELAHPVGRGRIFAERLLALLLSIVALTAAIFVATVVLVGTLDMEVVVEGIAAASLGLGLVATAFGVVTFAVGAVGGRRVAALAVGAGLAVLAYIADAVAPLVDWGGALEAASPFAWYLGPEPLISGFAPEVWGGLAGLAAVTVVAVVAGLAGFARRDLLT